MTNTYYENLLEEALKRGDELEIKMLELQTEVSSLQDGKSKYLEANNKIKSFDTLVEYIEDRIKAETESKYGSVILELKNSVTLLTQENGDLRVIVENQKHENSELMKFIQENMTEPEKSTETLLQEKNNSIYNPSAPSAPEAFYSQNNFDSAGIYNSQFYQAQPPPYSNELKLNSQPQPQSNALYYQNTNQFHSQQNANQFHPQQNANQFHPQQNANQFYQQQNANQFYQQQNTNQFYQQQNTNQFNQQQKSEQNSQFPLSDHQIEQSKKLQYFNEQINGSDVPQKSNSSEVKKESISATQPYTYSIESKEKPESYNYSIQSNVNTVQPQPIQNSQVDKTKEEQGMLEDNSCITELSNLHISNDINSNPNNPFGDFICSNSEQNKIQHNIPQTNEQLTKIDHENKQIVQSAPPVHYNLNSSLLGTEK